MRISQTNEIFQGFKNLIFPKQEIEVLAEARLRICFNCPDRLENKCGKCGCFLAAKTRSPQSKCPLNRW